MGTRLAMAALAVLAAGPARSAVIAPDARPGDPLIARAEVVYYDPAIDSFCGVIWRAPNGDLVVPIATKGDGMPTKEIEDKSVRSPDRGKTWQLHLSTRPNDRPLVCVSDAYYRLPNGRVLRYTGETIWPEMPDMGSGTGKDLEKYLAVAGGREFRSYYAVSDVDGNTFPERRLLTDPAMTPGNCQVFPQGSIVGLRNGDLLWPWGDWGAHPVSGFKRSADGGLTWGDMVRAYQDPPPGFSKTLGFNETAVAVCKDGTIVANARVDGAPGNDKRFWQVKSTDHGRTWTAPRQISIQGGGAAAMHCTPRGQLWLAYRDAGLSPGIGLAVSDDQGESWRYLYHLREPMGWGAHTPPYDGYVYTESDLAQPWRHLEGQVGSPSFAQLSDDEVYVVFYAGSFPDARPRDVYPTFIAGNLLRIPEPAAATAEAPPGK